ncbi:acyl-CoA dehydratase activase [Velocimicrobium porci]|uniref:CoA activase n=1 Tax=Velocimicrobium porci TaxID=2606634 RepID=A0A6L5XWT6_9FIRM|nr:acyl-CoA dehydratase activase [Velocimicrobium porci]MSS62808.1 CoA activase [Velocimicrobium porci]
MNYVGIDIGSTASKVVVLGDRSTSFTIPTGWSSIETARLIREQLEQRDISLDKNQTKVAATGYGRIAVSYADKVITEITCHGRGGRELAGDDCIVIDVGGQDTKVIFANNNGVSDFLMNDKCSAGTGKFVEIMANRLEVTIDGLFDLAKKGTAVPISSLCTVFAESEIINYIGEGRKKEDIAAGIIESVAVKVSQLCQKRELKGKIILTGGLSHIDYFAETLSKLLKTTVTPLKDGRYAGALGAALLIKER